MPYINKKQRENLEPLVDLIAAEIMRVHKETGTARGALTNFTISEILHSVFRDPRYADMAEARSALQESHDEYARRVIGPYENMKIAQEGDIRNFNSKEYDEKNAY